MKEKRGVELKSDFLVADAMHTKSDILASIGVITSLVITKSGFRIAGLSADTIAGLVIAFLIARIGYEILKKHLMSLSTQSALIQRLLRV